MNWTGSIGNLPAPVGPKHGRVIADAKDHRVQFTLITSIEPGPSNVARYSGRGGALGPCFSSPAWCTGIAVRRTPRVWQMPNGCDCRRLASCCMTHWHLTLCSKKRAFSQQFDRAFRSRSRRSSCRNCGLDVRHARDEITSSLSKRTPSADSKLSPMTIRH